MSKAWGHFGIILSPSYCMRPLLNKLGFFLKTVSVKNNISVSLVFISLCSIQNFPFFLVMVSLHFFNVQHVPTKNDLLSAHSGVIKARKNHITFKSKCTSKYISIKSFCFWSTLPASKKSNIKPSAHSRFLSLRHAIFVFSLKNLLCAVT